MDRGNMDSVFVFRIVIATGETISSNEFDIAFAGDIFDSIS